MKKRVLSLFLVLTMCLTLLPTASAATSEKATHDAVVSTVPVYFNTATTYTYAVKTDLLIGLELTNASYSVDGDYWFDPDWIKDAQLASDGTLTINSKSVSDPRSRALTTRTSTSN